MNQAGTGAAIIKEIEFMRFQEAWQMIDPENIDSPGWDGRTPLIAAVVNLGLFAPNHPPVPATKDEAFAFVEQLLAANADAGAKDNEGLTALHFAASIGHSAVTRALLGAGAPLEARDNYGNTPLIRAVLDHGVASEVVSLLVAAGANTHSQNQHGVSAVSLSESMGTPMERGGDAG